MHSVGSCRACPGIRGAHAPFTPVLARAFAAATFVLVVGCAASPGPLPATPDTLALFDRLMRSRCERAVRCSPSYDDYWATWPPPVECIDRVRLRDLVARGERTLDADAVATCLAALEADPPCRGPWLVERARHGITSPGAIACEGSVVDPGFRTCGGETCEPYDSCALDPDCTSRCAGRPGLGEPCDFLDAPCRDHLACDGATDTCIAFCDPWQCLQTGAGTECYGNRCVTPLGDGAACDPAVPIPCQVGSTCRRDILRCAPVLPIDATCDPATDACVTLLPCDATSHRCEAPTTSPPHCFWWEECPVGQTCIWAELAGDCAEASLVEGCSAIDDGLTRSDDCADGTECTDGWSSLQSALCRPRAVEGEPCGASVICEQGTRCSEGECRRTVLPWEPCGPESPCAPGFTCIDGACTAPFAHVGDPCEHGGDCVQGDCLAGHCAYRMPGETCPRGSECPDCQGGTCGMDLSAGRGAPCVRYECSPWLSCQPPSLGATDPRGYCCG
jgi:hypothetical protein